MGPLPLLAAAFLLAAPAAAGVVQLPGRSSARPNVRQAAFAFFRDPIHGRAGAHEILRLGRGAGLTAAEAADLAHVLEEELPRALQEAAEQEGDPRLDEETERKLLVARDMLDVESPELARLGALRADVEAVVVSRGLLERAAETAAALQEGTRTAPEAVAGRDLAAPPRVNEAWRLRRAEAAGRAMSRLAAGPPSLEEGVRTLDAVERMSPRDWAVAGLEALARAYWGGALDPVGLTAVDLLSYVGTPAAMAALGRVYRAAKDEDAAAAALRALGEQARAGHAAARVELARAAASLPNVARADAALRMLLAAGGAAEAGETLVAALRAAAEGDGGARARERRNLERLRDALDDDEEPGVHVSALEEAASAGSLAALARLREYASPRHGNAARREAAKKALRGALAARGELRSVRDDE